MTARTYGGRWRTVHSIGEGGQALTFEVRDLSDGSTGWVLKRLKNRRRLDRFEREIRALDALDSPRIPRTVDYSVADPAYHVTANVGVGLDAYAASSPLDLDRALTLFEQVVGAVRDAHGSAGVVHRDIKPNNVVVSGDGERAYLIDFGICQYHEGELTLLTTEEPFGNPAFAAPECSLGREEEPGPPCDVYSLGKLLYWMVSGRRYVNRENLNEAVLARIRTGSEVIRFHVARLLRGTILEDPAGRWTASDLLEEVRETRELVGRMGSYERRGEAVLTDGFGVDNVFAAEPLRSATTQDPEYPESPRIVWGNGPPGDMEIGTTFEAPLDRDVRLKEVTLAVQHRAGEDELDVRVVPEEEGRSLPDATLEAFKILGDGSFSPRVETVRSVRRPLLRRGSRYWVLLSVPSPHSDVAFLYALPKFDPRPCAYAWRRDGGEWEAWEAHNGPGHALRVTGNPAPGS